MATSPLPLSELNADQSRTVYAAAITTFALASIVVPLRILARKLTSTNLGWDDWFIFLAYLFASGVFGMTILWLKEGVGKHVQTVAVSDPNALIIILKSITPAEICYTLSICFAKYSILSFYSRIFGVTKMRIILITLAAIVTAWGVSVIVVSAVTCIPLKKLWDPTIPGICVDLPKFYLGISFPNVITDWIMLVIPMGYIWNLKMPTSQNVCVVSLVRLIFIAHLDFVDLTWGLVKLDLWTCVESFSAVFCACLPSLKPVYNLIAGKPQTKTPKLSTTSPYTRSKSARSKNKDMLHSAGDGTNGDSFSQLHNEEEWAEITASHAATGGSANGTDDVNIELNSIDRRNRNPL